MVDLHYILLHDKMHKNIEEYYKLSDKMIVECVLSKNKKTLKKVLKERKRFEKEVI